MLPSGICLITSLLIGNSGLGWTFYPPLSGVVFRTGNGRDFLMFSLHLAGISSIFRSIKFICTIQSVVYYHTNHEYVSVIV